MKNDRIVFLNGKPFAIRLVSQEQIADDETDLGECDHSKCVIKINKDQEGRLLMETLIHECLHAIMEYLREDTVSQAGREIADVLTQFGFMREGYRNGRKKKETS